MWANMLIIRYARARVGYAQLAQIWFWRCFENGVANDNKCDLFTKRAAEVS